MNLQKEIKKKIVGKTVVATIGEESLKVTLEMEPKKQLIELIDRYNKRPSKTAFDKINKIFHAKEEQKKTEILAKTKLAKKKVKEATKQLGEANLHSKQLDTALEDVKNLTDENKTLKEELENLKKAQVKTEKVVEQPAQTASTHRSGEY